MCWESIPAHCLSLYTAEEQKRCDYTLPASRFSHCVSLRNLCWFIKNPRQMNRLNIPADISHTPSLVFQLISSVYLCVCVFPSLCRKSHKLLHQTQSINNKGRLDHRTVSVSPLCVFPNSPFRTEDEDDSLHSAEETVSHSHTHTEVMLRKQWVILQHHGAQCYSNLSTHTHTHTWCWLWKMVCTENR